MTIYFIICRNLADFVVYLRSHFPLFGEITKTGMFFWHEQIDYKDYIVFCSYEKKLWCFRFVLRIIV